MVALLKYKKFDFFLIAKKAIWIISWKGGEGYREREKERESKKEREREKKKEREKERKRERNIGKKKGKKRWIVIFRHYP